MCNRFWLIIIVWFLLSGGCNNGGCGNNDCGNNGYDNDDYGCGNHTDNVANGCGCNSGCGCNNDCVRVVGNGCC